MISNESESPETVNPIKPALRSLPVDDLVVDPTLNLRDRLDDEVIQRYADIYESLPPINVFEVEGQWLVADGFHRHAAAVLLNKREISALIRQGSYNDALEFAACSNHHHGLPLNRHERRRAIEIKLKLRPELSDRSIAETTGASREWIAKIRRELSGSGEIPGTSARLGSDGKLYPVALPKDPYESLPKGPAVAQQPEPQSAKTSKAKAWDSADDPMPSPKKQDSPSKIESQAAIKTPVLDAPNSKSSPVTPNHDPASAPWEGQDQFQSGQIPQPNQNAPALEWPTSIEFATLNAVVSALKKIDDRVYDEEFEQVYRSAQSDTQDDFRRFALSIAARVKKLTKA